MKNPVLRLMKLCLPALLLMHALPVMAQMGKIHGKVMHEDNMGVIVRLLDYKRQVLQATLTDEEGKYSFEQLEPGTYFLYSKLSSDSIKVEVLVHPLEILNIDIRIDPKYRNEPMPCLCSHSYRPIPYYEVETDHEKLLEVMSDRNPYSLLAATHGGIYQADLGEPLQNRGARPTATTVYIDGQKLRGELQIPFAALRSVKLLQSGIPAEFGDATGGIVIINTFSYTDYDFPERGGANGPGYVHYPFWYAP